MPIFRWILASFVVLAALSGFICARMGASDEYVSIWGSLGLIVSLLIAAVVSPGSKVANFARFYVAAAALSSATVAFVLQSYRALDPLPGLIHSAFFLLCGMVGFLVLSRSKAENANGEHSQEQEPSTGTGKPPQVAASLLILGSAVSLVLLVVCGLNLVRYRDYMGTAEGLCAKVQYRLSRGSEIGSWAIPLLDRAIEMDSRFVPAFEKRARARLMMGDRDEALKDAKRALELEPRNPQLKELLGSIEGPRRGNDSSTDREDFIIGD